MYNKSWTASFPYEYSYSEVMTLSSSAKLFDTQSSRSFQAHCQHARSW